MQDYRDVGWVYDQDLDDPDARPEAVAVVMECKECGCLVTNVDPHDRFHDKVNNPIPLIG